MTSGIYKITSISHPDRIYIGSAKRQQKRKQEHWRRLQSGTHPNYRLLAHVKKYGLDDLEFEIIEKCAVKNLITREQFYIDTLKPSFNICKVAANTTGRPQSKETRRKRSVSLMGRKVSSESRHRMHLAKRKAPLNVIGLFRLVACGLFGDGRNCAKNHYQCSNCGRIKVCSQSAIKETACCGKREHFTKSKWSNKIKRLNKLMSGITK